MADGRRSKRLKTSHQEEDAPVTQKTRGRLRSKKSTSTQIFRFWDLPKELRLIIYEFAFAPSTRQVCMRIFPDAAYNATGAMVPLAKRTHLPHSLLLASKLLYDEAIAIFHRDTQFEVRCYLDKTEWTTRARRLGSVSDSRVFSHIQHLALQVYFEDDMDLFDYKHRLALLVSALGRGRKLATLDITFFWDWSGDRLLEPAEVRPLMLALASLACTSRAQVHWFDVEADEDGMEIPAWVPCDYRNMITELEDAIIL
ncbi:hypothetical protein LTR85_008491 [Meristemomyces frigidus]|nr:hypothetical protein LTR85_008491 [Meristemomyces frigidus]